MTTLDFNFFYCDYASEKKIAFSDKAFPKKIKHGLGKKKKSPLHLQLHSSIDNQQFSFQSWPRAMDTF